MANELDELNGPVNRSGNDVNVIDKQLHVKIKLKLLKRRQQLLLHKQMVRLKQDYSLLKLKQKQLS
jgi:hypothetical protein